MLDQMVRRMKLPQLRYEMSMRMSRKLVHRLRIFKMPYSSRRIKTLLMQVWEVLVMVEVSQEDTTIQ